MVVQKVAFIGQLFRYTQFTSSKGGSRMILLMVSITILAVSFCWRLFVGVLKFLFYPLEILLWAFYFLVRAL